MTINLSNYNNQDFNPGASTFKRILWYITNSIIIDSWLLPHSGLKCTILRLFGAHIGKGVVIKPRVNIKYPWFLHIGDYTWIGEGVWIDCLTEVNISANVCISQDAYILTGNHDYKDSSFSLILKKVVIEEGAWLGARSIVAPGVRVGRESVITIGSILQKDAMSNGIYRGNPAERIRDRIITNED